MTQGQVGERGFVTAPTSMASNCIADELHRGVEDSAASEGDKEIHASKGQENTFHEAYIAYISEDRGKPMP